MKNVFFRKWRLLTAVQGKVEAENKQVKRIFYNSLAFFDIMHL